MDEKERLDRYYKDCLWVGRTLSPLRGTERPPLESPKKAELKEDEQDQKSGTPVS
jgi:hypothetical protein